MKHNIQLVHGNIKFHLVCGGKRYNKNIACHGLIEYCVSWISCTGTFLHPNLVTAMQHGRYMVIDGVHRYTSLKALGCKKVPVQEIHETQYSISTWQQMFLL
ncbi:ParB N-terminal domain-containing protein [Staphylococcus aureus]|uniref:ParB N-terminal domain-containing protein n=1 Tax=Staphylococcus aureus TaxID=1280 RepID=UPI0009904BA4